MLCLARNCGLLLRCCFIPYSGVVITSASVTSTSITVFWEFPPQGGSSGNRQASCCIVGQPFTCSNNNEVQISNGNFSVGGLEEFTTYSCLISGVSAGYETTTLGDSKCKHDKYIYTLLANKLTRCQPLA